MNLSQVKVLQFQFVHKYLNFSIHYSQCIWWYTCKQYTWLENLLLIKVFVATVNNTYWEICKLNVLMIVDLKKCGGGGERTGLKFIFWFRILIKISQLSPFSLRDRGKSLLKSNRNVFVKLLHHLPLSMTTKVYSFLKSAKSQFVQANFLQAISYNFIPLLFKHYCTHKLTTDLFSNSKDRFFLCFI